MAYDVDPSIADAGSPRDAIARALMNITDPPPGGIHAPPGGIPPAQAAPGQMQPQVGGQMGAPVGGMAGQMPTMQPAAFGTTAPARGPVGPVTGPTGVPPTGPMGPVGGPYQPDVRLPGVNPAPSAGPTPLPSWINPNGVNLR